MSLAKKLKWTIALKMTVAVILGFILCQFPFYFLESYTYDLRMRASPSPEASSDIVIVKIDQKSLSQLNRTPRLIDLALAIKTAEKDGARFILPILPTPNHTNSTAAERNFFANVTYGNENIIYPLDDLPGEGEDNKLLLPPPLSHIKIVPAPFSADKVNFAADDVSRRTAIYYENGWLLPALIAQAVRPDLQLPFQGTFKYRGSLQINTNYRAKGSYNSISLVDVIEERFPVNTFTNKIVLIGKDALNETDDYLRTPLNRNALAMSKVEVFANMLDTLINDNAIVRPPEWIDWVITIIICLLTVYFVFNFRPIKALLALGSLAISYVLIAWAIFALFEISITMSHPLLAIFVSYYFFIPYRLIQESRRSWEYQQKNKLLTQVEELKTNFLSMMSHDLKTPLARIQGMADIALSNPGSLSIEQQRALQTIGESTEELSSFISSILDLGRIESEEVKLHLQSKDINALLNEVIKKYEYSAKQKRIEFVTEFEPLFSVKVDVDLIRQVFGNLIENAIKYSPEGSKVLVSTEEIDGHIVIQVADQGIGIPSEELDNVFMKFYRSKEVKNSPIKGSGLGLFLAKYFVDLHKGQITVESVPQQGSTFTVNIPMQ